MQDDLAKTFTRLWAGVEPALKTMLKQRFKEDPPTADEVLEKAYETAWSHFSKYRDQGHFYAWIRCFVRNKAGDTLRRQAHDPLYQHESLDALPPEVEAGNPRPDPAHDMAHECLAQMPEPERHLIELYYESELTQEQIAAHLQMPEKHPPFPSEAGGGPTAPTGAP